MRVIVLFEYAAPARLLSSSRDLLAVKQYRTQLAAVPTRINILHVAKTNHETAALNKTQR